MTAEMEKIMGEVMGEVNAIVEDRSLSKEDKLRRLGEINDAVIDDNSGKYRGTLSDIVKSIRGRKEIMMRTCEICDDKVFKTNARYEEHNKKFHKTVLEQAKKGAAKLIEKKEVRETINKLIKGEIKTGDHKFDDKVTELKTVAETYSGRRGRKYKSYQSDSICYHVTINPPKDATIDDLKNIARILVRTKMIKVVAYIFEQRGKSIEDIGKGCHIHIITESEGEMWKVRENIFRALRAKKGIQNDKDQISKESINIKNVCSEKHMETIGRYMKGQKQPSKMAAMQVTNIWRKNNNLEKIYIIDNTSGIFPEEPEQEHKKEGIRESIRTESVLETLDGIAEYVIVTANGKEYRLKIPKEEESTPTYETVPTADEIIEEESTPTYETVSTAEEIIEELQDTDTYTYMELPQDMVDISPITLESAVDILPIKKETKRRTSITKRDMDKAIDETNSQTAHSSTGATQRTRLASSCTEISSNSELRAIRRSPTERKHVQICSRSAASSSRHSRGHDLKI
jgi:hypothetical protein